MEKGRTSAVDGVPLGQPALSLAAKLLGRAERAGIDVRTPGPSLDGAFSSEEALGDALFAIVLEARRHGLDAERALRAADRRYVDAVHLVEAADATRGVSAP